MSGQNCTEYELGDGPELGNCHCPKCGGFLKRFLPDEYNFTCRKCGTELMVFPEVIDGEEQKYGKICPIKETLASNSESKEEK